MSAKIKKSDLKFGALYLVVSFVIGLFIKATENTLWVVGAALGAIVFLIFNVIMGYKISKAYQKYPEEDRVIKAALLGVIYSLILFLLLIPIVKVEYEIGHLIWGPIGIGALFLIGALIPKTKNK